MKMNMKKGRKNIITKKKDFYWPVVPICDAQKKDVKSSDILNDGLFRKCDIYKGGGGYDEFNHIYTRRTEKKINSVQFVVQLKGCPLSCPYCYVTRSGVHGSAKLLNTDTVIDAYLNAQLDVFHLMGGAPAIYVEQWYRIFERVKVFHSDFILVEKKYDIHLLNSIPGIHAVSIKHPGIYNDHQMSLLWNNMETIMNSKLNFYITFTGSDEMRSEIINRFGSNILKDSFIIPLIKYNALEV